MKSERFWVLVLALTSFGAGFAAGILLSLGRADGPSGPFAGYEAQMVETFDLDEEHLKNLRYILESYQGEVDALKERNLAALDPELVKVGRYHRELVRTYVVPEHRRQEFDLWVGGLPAVSSESRVQ
jgi:hypothetical protein